MSRLAPSLVILVLASFGAPAFAADPSEGWDAGADIRGGYQTYEPKDWTNMGEADDTLHIETGLRYWYSLGSYSLDGTSETDTAHSAEVFLRVDDYGTSTYAQGTLGTSILKTREFGDGIFDNGNLSYASADFGWSAFNDNQGNGFGGLIGYQYWQDSHDTNTLLEDLGGITYDDMTGQTNVPTYITHANTVEIQALRLGVQGKAEFNNFIDFRGELAAVPYANVSGHIGVETPSFSTNVYSGPAQLPFDGNSGNISGISATEADIDGYGHGAMAEAFVGIHPTENLTFRLGGRAWYVTGVADTNWTEVSITDPENQDVNPDYEVEPVATTTKGFMPNRPFSFLRYGILAEMTYAF
jgi:hypothetical protein